ncbi:unnamed protein product, partial [Pylaiella littoralis]
SVVDDTVPSFAATGGEGDEREEVTTTVAQLAAARVEKEGEGERPESAVNTAAVAGEVGRGERAPATDTFRAPTVAVPPATSPAPPPVAPQGVGGEGASGGRGQAKATNLDLLATAACSAGAMASDGGSAGGSRSGGIHDHEVSDVSQELAAAQVTGTQPGEAVAAPASAQAVVETPVPAREALVKGDGAVQAAGEAGAGEVTPVSSALAVVAQEPGEAQRLQKSHGSHDLLGHTPAATPAPVAAGEEEQGTVVRESLGSVVSTAPATPAPAAAREKQEEVVSEALAAAPQGVECFSRSGGGEGTGGGRGQASAATLDLLATAACLGTGAVASEGGSAGESGSGSENEGGDQHEAAGEADAGEVMPTSSE